MEEPVLSSTYVLLDILPNVKIILDNGQRYKLIHFAPQNPTCASRARPLLEGQAGFGPIETIKKVVSKICA